MDVSGKIHSFESFGTVDGPGLRFVIFMQGCLLRCLYCHNPDTWELNGGTQYTAAQVIDKIKRYVPYLKASGGGITVSGGEPLLQVEFLTGLFRMCKELDLHTAIDTSGCVSTDNSRFDELMEYTDLVLLDIKHINNDEHKKLTGRPNTLTLEFAKYLDRKNIPMWVRHVLVPGITDDSASLHELSSFLKALGNIKNIEVLPFHNMGAHKWESLKIDYKLHDKAAPSESDVKRAKEILSVPFHS